MCRYSCQAFCRLCRVVNTNFFGPVRLHRTFAALEGFLRYGCSISSRDKRLSVLLLRSHGSDMLVLSCFNDFNECRH